MATHTYPSNFFVGPIPFLGCFHAQETHDRQDEGERPVLQPLSVWIRQTDADVTYQTVSLVPKLDLFNEMGVI